MVGASESIQTAFPPLLIELRQQQDWLSELTQALLDGSGIALPDGTWDWYRGDGARIAAQFADPELRRAWSAVDALRNTFLSNAAACLDAAGRNERDVAKQHLARLFDVTSAALELVLGASVREMTEAFRTREHALARRYERRFMDAARIGRVTLNLPARSVEEADTSFAALFGKTPEQLRELDAERLLGVQACEALVAGSVNGATARVSASVVDASRTPVRLDIVAYRERIEDDERLHCFVVDSSKAHAEAEQRRLLSTAIEASDQLVVITNAEQHIVYVNGAFTRVTGYSAAEVVGKNPRFLQGPGTSQATRISLREAITRGGGANLEILNYRKSGEQYWVDLSIVPVSGPAGEITHWIAIQRDITARKEQEQEITRLAMEDYLTGLPNRRAAETRLQVEWNRARRDLSPFAVALVDVDRFKLVNDQYGHQIGDVVLVHLAKLLSSNLRGGDWIARWGGEEFLLCFHDLDARGALSAGERARKLVRSKPAKLAQGELPLSVSIGISLYGPESESLDAMLASADSLLYQAKQSGRDKVLCAGVSGVRRGSLIWEGSQVQSALHEQRVVPAYQPIVDLRTGDVVGEEALARIVNSGAAPIPAQRFIGAAEQLQLVAAIDGAVSQRALERAARSSKRGGTKARFINLSTQFLSDPERVAGLLDQARGLGLVGNGNPNPLVVEITERQSGDLALLNRHLQPLVDEGFRLALDDFGSGYSSFMYLTELPMHFLKIEGWMVGRITGDTRIRQLVDSIVNTAARFNLKTVAECVETAESAQVLCDIGVDWAQGHFFAKAQLAN